MSRRYLTLPQCELSRRLPAARWLFGGVATLVTGLSILAVGLAGCNHSKGAKETPLLGPLTSRGTESKAERDALRKAVEKDPFPAARSKRVDLEG